MYVVVVYDLPIEERPPVFRLLNQRLQRLQNSVFAGEMSQHEATELRRDLEKLSPNGACLMWVFDRIVQPALIGTQSDRETNIL